jgi:large subunit ribosomal protein L19
MKKPAGCAPICWPEATKNLIFYLNLRLAKKSILKVSSLETAMRTMSKLEEAKNLLHSQFKKADLPNFKAGDTINIHYRITEGNKERIQQFQGVVIQRRGSQGTEMVTVRKISNGVGVERVIPLHSPYIDKIEVKKAGFVRRARIFYLRKLEGKAARIRGAKS